MLYFAPPFHHKAVLGYTTLIARARHNRTPTRLRPGDYRYRLARKLRHGSAIAAQAFGGGEHQGRAMCRHFPPHERWHGVQIEAGKIRKNGLLLFLRIPAIIVHKSRIDKQRAPDRL